MPRQRHCRRACIGGSYATAIIYRLEKQGLIRRTPSKSDRREITIDLTNAGKKNLTKANTIQKEIFTERLSHLSPKEINTFLSLLRKING